MPYISGKYYPLRRIVFFIGEGCLIFGAIFLMHILFLGWDTVLLHKDLCLPRTFLSAGFFYSLFTFLISMTWMFILPWRIPQPG